MSPFNEKMAKAYQKRWSQHLHTPVVQTNSIGMKLVLIPPGEFDMGSPKDLSKRKSGYTRTINGMCPICLGEAPRHRVRITKPFWLGATHVTQEEYEQVMGRNPE